MCPALRLRRHPESWDRQNFMKHRAPARIVLALVTVPGLFVIVGYFSIVKSLQSLEQPMMALRPNVMDTRTIPVAVQTLKPGDVIQPEDIQMRPWPVRRIVGDVILSDRQVFGSVVVKEITSGVPIAVDSLKQRRHGDSSVGNNL